MTWANPSAFWWFLLAIPIVGMFMYRRRAVRAVIPSLDFWKPHGHPVVRKGIGKYLSNPITLLIAISIVGLLVSALAEPGRATAQESELVFVLDAGVSMQTQEAAGLTRFSSGLQVVQDTIRSYPNGTSFTILIARQYPHAIAIRKCDRESILSDLSMQVPIDAPSDLPSALRYATTLRTLGKQTQTFVVTDKPHMKTEIEAAQAIPVWVGEPHQNIGISGLNYDPTSGAMQVTLSRSGLESPGRYTIQCSKVDSRGKPDGDVVSTDVTFNGNRESVTLIPRLQPGDPFLVSITPGDAFHADDFAWGVWPESTTLKVDLVTEGNPFLQAALMIQDRVELRIHSPRGWTHDPSTDLTIVDAEVPGQHENPSGRYLFWGVPDPFGWVTRNPDPGTHKTQPAWWKTGHPVLKDVDPSLWDISQLAGLQTQRPTDAIAGSSDSHIIFELFPGLDDDEGNTQAVYINFAAGDSNLVLSPSFPVLLWNIVEYLLHCGEDASDLSYCTGTSYQHPRIGNPDVQLIDPNGSILTRIANGNMWTWIDTDYAGIYTLQDSEGTISLQGYSVWGENDAIDTQENKTFSPLDHCVMDAVQPFFPEFWMWLCGCACLVVLTEWFLFYFKIIHI